jgi:hypothetical protein
MFAKAPTYLGPTSDIATITRQGQVFVEQAGGALQEVNVFLYFFYY